MPLINKGNCWKFGKSGKLYCGINARKKALKQGRAIKASQSRRKKK